MSMYHVRAAGKVYGPFSTEQLQQLSAAGRLNNQAEVSIDKLSWRPIAEVLAGAGGQPVGGGSAAATVAAGRNVTDAGDHYGDAGKYLEALRNRTRYPFYRTSILIYSILGYVLAAIPIFGLVIKVFWTGISSVQVYEPFAVILGSALIAAFVTVLREVFSMYADFVDSTLDFHARATRPREFL